MPKLSLIPSGWRRIGKDRKEPRVGLAEDEHLLVNPPAVQAFVDAIQADCPFVQQWDPAQFWSGVAMNLLHAMVAWDKPVGGHLPRGAPRNVTKDTRS